ncbi:MAG: hypothetical protein IJY57_04890 [Clostridia bacterium]|nr:hypothetical protein [Clostridia bacterium]
MNTKFSLNNKTRNVLIIILSFLMVLSASIGALSLVNKAKAASYDFVMVSDSMDTKYQAHWRIGQNQTVSGETYGLWSFGVGDIAAGGSYSYTQATFDNSAGNYGYTTGTAHSFYWGESVNTRLYSSSKTQSMFRYYANAAGSVVFSGLISKATTDKQDLGGTQNGYDKLWIAGPNWGNGDYNWVSGQAYSIGMYKVDGQTGAVTAINEKSYSSEFVYLVPKDPITVKAGDEIYFTYKCTATSDEYKTTAIALFTSQFTLDPSSGETGGSTTTTGGDYVFFNQAGTDGLNDKYISHWKAGQSQHISGETNGTWQFGSGDVSTSKALSFTAASVGTADADGNRVYTSGSNHNLYYQSCAYNALYSTASTQTMYVLTAEQKATFVFSGLISKATSNKEQLAGTQNNYNPVWIAGVNHTDAAYNWANGHSYTVGMYKVASTGTVTKIHENTFTSEYAWLVPQTEHVLNAGDKMVFTIKCNAAADVNATGTLVLLSSKAVEYVENPDVVVPDEPEDTRPETLDDIITTSGFTKIAHYKFANNGTVATDSLGNYNLTNSGIAVDSTLGGAKLSGTSFMYAPAIAQDGSDFSDAVKGSFSVSFKARAILSNDETGHHMLFGTGLNADGDECFGVSWQGNDLVVIASGQEYRIDNAKIENDMGETETLKMLDETASWYRYTIIYNENNNGAITLTIRVDRFTDAGMYGTMTVITQKTLKNKISFGGSLEYGFAIGASTTLGAYQENFASGYDFEGNAFSPNIADLRIYSGVIDDAEILQIWKDDEGANWFDRSATYSMTIENDANGGIITGVKNNVNYGVNTSLNISVQANTGYTIASITWNGTMVPVTNTSTMTFTKQVKQDTTLRVTYNRIKHQVTVKENGVVNNELSGEYGYMSKFSIAVDAVQGSKITGCYVNGEEITLEDSRSFAYEFYIQEDTVVELTFEKIKYNLNFKIAKTTIEDADENGEIGKISNSQYKNDRDNFPQVKCELGEEMTIELVAPEGNEIRAITWGKEVIDLTEDSDGVEITKTGEFVTAVKLTKVIEGNTDLKIHFNQVAGGGAEEVEMAGCESGILTMELGLAMCFMAGALLVIKKAKKN